MIFRHQMEDAKWTASKIQFINERLNRHAGALAGQPNLSRSHFFRFHRHTPQFPHDIDVISIIFIISPFRVSFACAISSHQWVMPKWIGLIGKHVRVMLTHYLGMTRPSDYFHLLSLLCLTIEYYIASHRSRSMCPKNLINHLAVFHLSTRQLLFSAPHLDMFSSFYLPSSN